MDSTICRVAVIGTGNIGYHHCRNFKNISNVQLVAVADFDSVRCKKVADEFSCSGYTDYKKLLKIEKPHAVTIATPTISHYKIAKDCLIRNIHVLVEKPITLEPRNGEEMVSLARQKNLIFTVGHVERFNPALQKLKKLVDDGELGDITNIMARRLGGYPSKMTDIGVYYDLAVHDLDIFYYLLKQLPLNIRVHKLNVFSNIFDDSTTILAEYAKANGIIQANWITPVKIRQLAVIGTRGYAEVNYINQSLELYERNVEPGNFDEKDFEEFVYKYGNLTKKEIKINKDEPLRLELENFIGAIMGKSKLVVNADDVLKTMKIMKKYDH